MKIKREDIHIIARHSNLSSKDIAKILQKDVYNDKTTWVTFLRLFFMALGIGLTTAGIIFFFAYNWNEIHKFTKLGLIQSGIIATTLIIFFSKLKLDIKNIILTGLAMLVGVLYAVFGQIYQTGANAYDFFLSWTISITIWVFVSNFVPLWLVFISLINTTLWFYLEQVAPRISEDFVFSLFFSVNLFFLISGLLLKHKDRKIPNWFIMIISLVLISIATIGIGVSFFKVEVPFSLLWGLVIMSYILGVLYGLKTKSTFFLSIIPFSAIIIITTFFVSKLENNYLEMTLFIGLFVVISVTLVIKNLLNLQKKWKN